MDGYSGSDDIVEKLEYATVPYVDLYWGDVMDLLRESLHEIKNLRKEKKKEE